MGRVKEMKHEKTCCRNTKFDMTDRNLAGSVGQLDKQVRRWDRTGVTGTLGSLQHMVCNQNCESGWNHSGNRNNVKKRKFLYSCKLRCIRAHTNQPWEIHFPFSVTFILSLLPLFPAGPATLYQSAPMSPYARISSHSCVGCALYLLLFHKNDNSYLSSWSHCSRAQVPGCLGSDALILGDCWRSNSLP